MASQRADVEIPCTHAEYDEVYQKCKLVHGDISEDNILYYEVSYICYDLWYSIHVGLHLYSQVFFLFDQGHLYVIDVSQSVDLDHPHALDFLREDCVHVSVSYPDDINADISLYLFSLNEIFFASKPYKILGACRIFSKSMVWLLWQSENYLIL